MNRVIDRLLVFAGSRAILFVWIVEEPHGYDDRFHGCVPVSPAHAHGQHR